MIVGALPLALALALVGEVTPASSPEDDAATETRDAPEPIPAAPHFVFANTYGVTAGVSPYPSGDVSLFFGRALRSRATWRLRWAIGLTFTLSIGGAERYFYISRVTHRYHLGAVGHGGPRGRLFAAASGGVALLADAPVLEAEGRVGYLFGRRRGERRRVGVVGASARLGLNFAYREKLPMPQVGVFVGVLVR